MGGLGMRHVSPDRWKWALIGYGSAGVAAAALIEPLGNAAAMAGVNGVLGVVLVANLIYPAAVIAVAVWYPRLRLIPPGAVLSLVGFTAVRMAWRDIRFWNWTPDLFLSTVHPIIVAGTVVAAMVAAGACLALRGIRRVGIADAHLRCGACGYLVRKAAAGEPIAGRAQCPECGAAIDGDPATEARL